MCILVTFLVINPGGHSAWEKNAGGEQEMMEAGDKETLEGQTIERKRKRSDGINVSTRDAYTYIRMLSVVVFKKFGREIKLAG